MRYALLYFFFFLPIGGNKFVYIWFLFLTFSEATCWNLTVQLFPLLWLEKIVGLDTTHSIRSEAACAPSCLSLSRVPHYMSLLKSLKVKKNVKSIANSPILEETKF